MRITALPAAFHRANNIRPPELSPTAAHRLRLLEQWRAIRAHGATAQRAADILRAPRASLYRWQASMHARGLPGLEPEYPGAPATSASPSATRPSRPCSPSVRLLPATARTRAARFLDAIVERMPFPTRLSMWTAAPSYGGSLRRRAGNATSGSSCCRRTFRQSWLSPMEYLAERRFEDAS